VSGFTSGIALVIAIGQLDELTGIPGAKAETAALQLVSFVRAVAAPNWAALGLGIGVMVMMLAWPRRWRTRVPASLVGIAVAAIANSALAWGAPVIGAIPQSPLLADRLSFATIPWSHLGDFVAPALTITALGAVESLLCGAVASERTGVRLAANQELIAQGAGNAILPFLGGVPATAAIARTGVGIEAGGRTRIAGIVHALVLLASMLVLGPVMARIPRAALAGVLMVTAWRMSEWDGIRFIFGRRFKTAMATFLITMIATVVLDLTQAILIGAVLSAGVFLNQIAALRVVRSGLDMPALRARGVQAAGDGAGIEVAFVTGPLFFAAVGTFNEAFAGLAGVRCLVLSMRGVPLVDTSGLQALAHLSERLHAQGARLLLAAVHPPVRAMLERGGLLGAGGATALFATTDEAIAAAVARQSSPARGMTP